MIRSMNICVLCLDECSSKGKSSIEIFSTDGLKLDLSSIITKYFWFQPKKEFAELQKLCSSCLTNLMTFHNFYERVYEVHKSFACKQTMIISSSSPAEHDVLTYGFENEFNAGNKTFAWKPTDFGPHQNSSAFSRRSKNWFTKQILSSQKNSIKTPTKIIDSVNRIPAHSEKSKSDSSDVTLCSKSMQCLSESAVLSQLHNKPSPNTYGMKKKIYLTKKKMQSEYDKQISRFFQKIFCSKCSFEGQNFGELKTHFRTKHSKFSGFVTCCGRKFYQRKPLTDHISAHWNPEHLRCSIDVRSLIFSDEQPLEEHQESHKSSPEPKEKHKFQCNKCPKLCTSKLALEYHSFSKHVPISEFKFDCSECYKKLPTERKLKDHIKYMHDPESRKICDRCGKLVRSEANLKRHHQKEHSEEPRPIPVPIQCDICGTWLRHLAGLKQHVKTIHEKTGIEHRCHICNKISTNSRALKRHIYHNHVCEKKFKCAMCDKAFKRPQDLREHISTHTGEILYTCPNCPMTFFSNANMYKHRQRLHRREWEEDKKNPLPPNILQQAMCATEAMKLQQSKGISAIIPKNLGSEKISTID